MDGVNCSSVLRPWKSGCMCQSAHAVKGPALEMDWTETIEPHVPQLLHPVAMDAQFLPRVDIVRRADRQKATEESIP